MARPLVAFRRQRGRLLALAWWDWPDERLRALEDALYGPVEAFLERCGG